MKIKTPALPRPSEGLVDLTVTIIGTGGDGSAQQEPAPSLQLGVLVISMSARPVST